MTISENLMKLLEQYMLITYIRITVVLEQLYLKFWGLSPLKLPLRFPPIIMTLCHNLRTVQYV